MTIGKILAPLTGGARDATVLASAFAAAKPFNAHVVALFVRPDPAEAMPFFGEGVSGVVVQEIVDVAKDAADKASEEAKKSLRLAAEAGGVLVLDAPAHRDAPSVSFRDVQGNFADRVTLAGRLADLVVFGPLKEGDKPGLTEAFEATLLETGRPVLLTAQIPPRDFARNVAVAWDESLASAHALSAALPYLAKADAVEILAVRRGGADEIQSAEIVEYLALQGLSCTCRTVDAGSRPVGEALLEAASGAGAGLLVLGGYGHSRLRQFFAGGVTRHVVSHANLPLFLVH
jgi:nucleotide-binding universal stress UspA family protein